MTIDIRLHTTFFRHPKTVKLRKKCGLEGVFCLLKLWLWVRENKPDGIMGGQEDVEIAAEWEGEEGLLYNTLIDVKYIVKQDSGNTSLYNWAKRNPWAVGAVSRQLIAKKGGCAKHGKKCEECKDDCPNSTQFCLQQVLAPAPSPAPLLSSPLPISKDILLSFNEIWNKYPMKAGKKEALRHYKATVKCQEDADNCEKALVNYLKHLALPQNSYKHPMNGSTWFNNWQDYLEWVEPETPDEPGQKPDMSDEQYDREMAEIDKKREDL